MWKSIEYSKEKLNEIIEMTVEYYGKDNDISQKAFLEHEHSDENENYVYGISCDFILKYFDERSV